MAIMNDEYLVAVASDHRLNVVISLPTVMLVGEDTPALFPALILMVRLQLSSFWGRVTRIVVI